jgi:hypothetical protein
VSLPSLAPSIFVYRDPAFLSIMTQTDSFPKPENFRQGLAELLGQGMWDWVLSFLTTHNNLPLGLLFAESDAHKRQVSQSSCSRMIGANFIPPSVASW